MKILVKRLAFASPVRVSISRKQVSDVEGAAFLLSSMWPNRHILSKDGLEPAPLKRAREACGLAAAKRTKESVEYARQRFIEAASSAGLLLTK